MMYAVKIPKIGNITAATISELSTKVRQAIELGGFGASDIGARWTVYEHINAHPGIVIGVLSYNGRWQTVAQLMVRS